MRIWLPVLAATLAACGGDGSSSPPAQSLEDTTPPVITLIGDNPQIIEAGEAYVELGATATDNLDGDVSGSIVIDASAVDTAVPGEYPVTYDVSDASGNAASTVTRTVICQDTTAPVITLKGANPQTLSQGNAYVELGATAMDMVDGDLTATLVIDASAVDTATVGDYTVTYDVSDAAGNAAVTVMRTVSVVLAVPAVPKVSVAADIKQLIFSWNEIPYADYYRLLENPDGSSGFTQVGEDIPTGTTSVTIPVAVHLQDWLNAEYVVEACNRKGCNSSGWVNTAHLMLDTIGYFKASNAEGVQLDDQGGLPPDLFSWEKGDGFGQAVAISVDGRTIAVGAPYEDSGATGINGSQQDNSAFASGAVYVFRSDGTSWFQQAYVKASNTDGGSLNETISKAYGDTFGSDVALSADGNTLAVAAPREDGSSTEINGIQSDNLASGAGAVYIFRFSDGEWEQQAYLKASNTDAGDVFGHAISLSADGTSLLVCANGEDSNATGIDGYQDDNSARNAGAGYLFQYHGGNWQQQTYIKGSDTVEGDGFCSAGALSADGNTIAISATLWGHEPDPGTGLGAVYVFRFEGDGWREQAKFVTRPYTNWFQFFGNSISLSGDGNTLAVADQTDDGYVGTVYVFRFDDTDWNEPVRLRPLTVGPNGRTGTRRDMYCDTEDGPWCAADHFGNTVSISANGDILAASAPFSDSSAVGINGDPYDDSSELIASGAVYVFRFHDEEWQEYAYVKATNPGDWDNFGMDAVALSADGTSLVVGAWYESSVATGISGDQSDNSARGAGAVYMY